MRVIEIQNLQIGAFESRPNRFVVKLRDGRLAHLHDPGRLAELLVPGAKLALKVVDSGNRKTNLDVVAVKSDYWIFLNSAYHSKIAERIIPIMFGSIKSKEVKFGRSRLDFLLSDGRPLEVKGCTLINGKTALFPDAPTERGTRHVMELTRAGGALLFLVFHPSAEELRPNCQMDPKFCEAMRLAKGNVEMKAAKFRTRVHSGRLVLDYLRNIPVIV